MKKIAFLLAVLLLISCFVGCGNKEEEEILAAEPTESIPYEGEFDHMHTNGAHVFTTEVLAEANCTQSGKVLHICVICGEGFEETVDPYGHELDAPTCTEAGRCINCNTVIEKPMGHKVKDGICERCRAVVD